MYLTHGDKALIKKNALPCQYAMQYARVASGSDARGEKPTPKKNESSHRTTENK